MEEKVIKKKSTAKKILDVIVNIVIVLYLVFTVLISISIFATIGNDNGVPALFGNSLMNVLTDSMEGDAEDSLNKGDLAICKTPKDRYALKVGDVIAFRTTIFLDNKTEQSIIKIHRIAEINEQGAYITAGDNVDENKDGVPDRDEIPVIPTDVLGKYTGTKIPGGGNFFDFVTSQKGIMICLVIPMAIFFIWALFKFIKAIVEFKYSKAPANVELSDEQKQKAIEEYLAKQAAEKAEADLVNLEETTSNDTSEE